jgi:hypothetical protein
MNHVTEIVPDLDTMPDWARKAFEDGQFFRVALDRVKEMEGACNDLLDATGHSTWSKLFQAPTVTNAISRVKKALENKDES